MKLGVIGTFVLAALCSAWAAQAAPKASPSFDCAKAASVVEKTICSDASLAQRDAALAEFFANAKINALGTGPSPEIEAQKAWVKEQREICPRDINCLRRVYDFRLRELAVATLFIAPETSLAEIRRQAPNDEPIYEAIYQYATIDEGAARKRAVETVIAPRFLALRDPNFGVLDETSTPATVVASDGAFAQFLNAASVAGHEKRGQRALSIPCAALARRPGLLVAFHPLFGGTMDTMPAREDCRETVARLPALNKLIDLADADHEQCPGTIKYSEARNYERTIAAILLHHPEVWASELKDIDNPDELRFRAKHRAAVSQAVDEVDRFYVSTFHLPSDRLVAEQAAKMMVHRVYTDCG